MPPTHNFRRMRSTTTRLFSSDIHDQMPCKTLISNSGRSARAAGIGKRTCVRYVTWVEISTPEFAENGRGVDVKRQPQAIPELEITQRAPGWRRDTGAQASEA